MRSQRMYGRGRAPPCGGRESANFRVVRRIEIEQGESLDLAVRVEGAALDGRDARGCGRRGARGIKLDAV